MDDSDAVIDGAPTLICLCKQEEHWHCTNVNCFATFTRKFSRDRHICKPGGKRQRASSSRGQTAPYNANILEGMGRQRSVESSRKNRRSLFDEGSWLDQFPRSPANGSGKIVPGVAPAVENLASGSGNPSPPLVQGAAGVSSSMLDPGMNLLLRVSGDTTLRTHPAAAAAAAGTASVLQQVRQLSSVPPASRAQQVLQQQSEEHEEPVLQHALASDFDLCSLQSPLSQVLQLSCDELSSEVVQTSHNLWNQMTKSGRDSTFMRADVHVHTAIDKCAESASKFLQAGSMTEAVDSLLSGQATGGSDSATISILPSPKLPLPFAKSERIFPTGATALAGRVALLRALQLSSAASIDGPLLPAIVDTFMHQAVTSDRLPRNQLPQAGDSVLVFHEDEDVQHALAFVLSRDSACLNQLPQEKQLMLDDHKYIPVAWCINAGDSPANGGLSRDAQAMLQQEREQAGAPGAQDAGVGTGTQRHVFSSTALDVIHCDNIVETGQIAIADSEATLRLKRPVFVQNRSTLVTPAEVQARQTVPVVLSPASHDEASSLGADASRGDVDYIASLLPEDPITPDAVLDLEQMEQVIHAVDHLTALLRQRFTKLPCGPPKEVVVIERTYNTSLSQKARGPSAARVVLPSGKCSAAGTSAAACKWWKGQTRDREHVISSESGIVPIQLRQYRCSVHMGTFEVGTRQFFADFKQLFPDAGTGVQLSVPLIPITQKIRMDEAAAQELWSLYCGQYKEGVAAICRSFTKWVLKKMLHRLHSVDSIKTVQLFLRECSARLKFVTPGWLHWMRRKAVRELFEQSAELLLQCVSVHRVDAAILQLHHSIITCRMPRYWDAMARFAACIAVDFTFKTASRFTVSRREHGKIVVSKVHATLCTIVGQHGFLVAGQIGGGHENAARMFIPVTEIFRRRQALSREVGVASSKVAAVAVDNPASTTKTLLLAVASVWAVATGAFNSTEVHMDHWHFVQRVRAVARSYHQPDSHLFATIWGMFGVWLIKPSLGVCAEYLTAQSVPTQAEMAMSVNLFTLACKGAQELRGKANGKAVLTWKVQEMVSCALCGQASQSAVGSSAAAVAAASSAPTQTPVTSQDHTICHIHRLAFQICCLQTAIANWIEIGFISDDLKVACRQCLDGVGWGMLAPLCAEVLSSSTAQTWRPLQCTIRGEEIEVPATVLFAVAKYVGSILRPRAVSELQVGATAELDLADTEDASAEEQLDAGMDSDMDDSETDLLHQSVLGGEIQQSSPGSAAAAAGQQQGAAAQPASSPASLPTCCALREFGPTSVKFAQQEISKIVKMFSFVLRADSSVSVEVLLQKFADSEREGQSTAAASEALHEESPEVIVDLGENGVEMLGGEQAVDEEPDSDVLQTPIVLTQRHDAAEGDSTDCRDTYERAAKNSIMSGRRIVKQALACLHNSTALAGMIAQQSFPLNFGGTNHAEAAHAKLSQALGPGNCLSVDKAQQRLELHALIHNQQKARRLGVGKLDKRKQAQQSLLDEYERLVGSTFERSLTSSSHPLCTGPVFSALLSGPAFKPRTVEQLKQDGINTDMHKKPHITEKVRRDIIQAVAEEVAEHANGTSRFVLSTFMSRLRTKLECPGLTAAQIKRVLLESASMQQ